jgi:cytochrome subunit of sulfide dehydrogenase
MSPKTRPKAAMSRLLRFALVSLAVPAAALAQSPQPGRDLAAACANCHGTNGASVQGMPYLAGQSRGYIVERMHEYKTGKRPATIMHQVAKGYTDEQIEAMASYFSAQKGR